MSTRFGKYLKIAAEKRELKGQAILEEKIEKIICRSLILAESKNGAGIERTISRLRADYRSSKLMTFGEFLNILSKAIGFAEARGNSWIEGIAVKLRNTYRKTELKPFRDWLEIFSAVIG